MQTKHLPGRHDQDDHGDGDAAADLAKADRLKLAGKVPPGVTVRASRKARTDDGQDLLVAEVETGDGRQTRVGVIYGEDSKKWDGGYPEQAEQDRIDEIRQELAEMDDEADDGEEIDDQLYDDLTEELGELEDEGKGNHTVGLDDSAVGDLKAQLAKAEELAVVNREKQVAAVAEIDGLQTRRDALFAEHGDAELEQELTEAHAAFSAARRRWAMAAADSNEQRAAAERAKWQQSMDEWQERIDELEYVRYDGMPEEVIEELDDIEARLEAMNAETVDDMITSGSVAGAGGTLHFQTWGSDSDDGGWSKTRVAIKPDSAGDDWTFEDAERAEDYSQFDGPKGIGNLLKGLLGDAAEAKHVSRLRTHAKSTSTRSGRMLIKTRPQTGFTVKAADRGEFTAVLATLNEIDSDGDVTVPGAFDDGEFPLSSYGHKSWEGALPVGVAKVKEAGNEVIIEGRFFLDTVGGRDTFRTVKHLGPLGQWSYGYDVVKSRLGYHNGEPARFLEKLKVHEGSPVLVGAGVNTRTLSTKGHHSFNGEAQAVLAACKALAARAADVMAMRRSKGKGLGAESSALLTQVNAELTRFGDLLADPAPPPYSPADVRHEFLRFAAAIAKE